jgi:hypothetical protein
VDGVCSCLPSVVLSAGASGSGLADAAGGLYNRAPQVEQKEFAAWLTAPQTGQRESEGAMSGELQLLQNVLFGLLEAPQCGQ